jgi:hypothetical protein
MPRRVDAPVSVLSKRRHPPDFCFSVTMLVRVPKNLQNDSQTVIGVGRTAPSHQIASFHWGRSNTT